jgi:hypothetical protein
MEGGVLFLHFGEIRVRVELASFLSRMDNMEIVVLNLLNR